MARPFDMLPPEMERQGPPPGQARREILFIHGAWSGPWYWQGLSEPLARAGFGVNLLALPGHGPRPWDLPNTTSLTDYALHAARAAGQLERPVLVGHSMGGWLVMKLLEVADPPAILLAPLPPGGMRPWRMTRLFLRFPRALAPTLALGRLRITSPQMYRRVAFRRLDQERLMEWWPRLVPEPGRVALEMGLGLRRARPRPGRSPRLLIAGGQDWLMPAAGLERLAQNLGAGYRLLPELPHALWPEDESGQVAALILAFLEGLEA